MQLPILLALLVLVLVERCCTAATLHRGGGRTMMDLVGRHTRLEAGFTGHGLKTGERKSRSHHRAESHHRDPQHKDKFIIHLTGPLNVNPKCRKHFNRLYYNTRDCTVPAYYKRCARLLTRLASSPRCSET